jgi:pimeloyl-ACP methyl ester carboxylesterase
VTALDLRGCGRSERPADGYGIPDLAEDDDQVNAMIDRFLELAGSSGARSKQTEGSDSVSEFLQSP